MYEELINRLRAVSKIEVKGEIRPGVYSITIDAILCIMEIAKDAANAIDELLKAAKAMHTWIFLHTGDEQAAYDECGLSDEMNAMLGYGGQFVAELPKETVTDSNQLFGDSEQLDEPVNNSYKLEVKNDV